MNLCSVKIKGLTKEQANAICICAEQNEDFFINKLNEIISIGGGKDYPIDTDLIPDITFDDRELPDNQIELQ